MKRAGRNEFGPDLAECLKGPYLCSEQDEFWVQQMMGSKVSLTQLCTLCLCEVDHGLC